MKRVSQSQSGRVWGGAASHLPATPIPNIEATLAAHTAQIHFVQRQLVAVQRRRDRLVFEQIWAICGIPMLLREIMLSITPLLPANSPQGAAG